MKEKKERSANPWFFIPTQYFAEGVPYIIVNQLSVALFKSLEATNAFIGATSLLSLPWSVKFLWGPIVDGYFTKRKWLLWMQFLMSVLLLILSISFVLPNIIIISLGIFILMALLSSTHDIATDGYYLIALDKKQQAFFSGIRSTFYRIAMIFSGGFLLYLSDLLAKQYHSIHIGWSLTFAIAGLIILLIFFYHLFILPKPFEDKAVISENTKIPFKQAFATYFKQEKIGFVIAFILVVRLGEGMLLKMLQPFLNDPIDKGGMNFQWAEIGIMYGTFGVIALVIGGILSGWIIKKYGLRKTIFPLILCMNIPNVLYAFLAFYRPMGMWTIDLSFLSFLFGNGQNLNLIFNPFVQFSIIIEQFGYGLGFTAFMVFLLYFSKGEFKTSHYAISTGFMAIGLIIPGFISGFLQEMVGYNWLFVLSTIATIPGMILLFFIPINDD
ncbi:MAG: MFS transporter [Candidatus Kapabacteria bacterium]|nr:MFS transporter [Candidatus Kapabacteria bacterium]